MTTKQWMGVILVSAVTSAGSFWGVSEYRDSRQSKPEFSSAITKPVNAKYADFNAGDNNVALVDFEAPATKAAPAVVHIRTLTKARQVSGNSVPQDNPFRDFFGDGFGDMFGGRGNAFQSPEQRASGSGVIISSDGYIVTNNHVVDG